MKKSIPLILILLVFVLSASTQTDIAIPTGNSDALWDDPVHPDEEYGPDNFPNEINPLTGLPAAYPALLDRRPLAVKISNGPRGIRPLRSAAVLAASLTVPRLVAPALRGGRHGPHSTQPAPCVCPCLSVPLSPSDGPPRVKHRSAVN